jgi:hypothetical protein
MSKFDNMSNVERFLSHYPQRAQVGLQQIAHRLGRRDDQDRVRNGVELRLLNDSQFRQGVLDTYLAVATELYGEMIFDGAEQDLGVRASRTLDT